MIRFGNKFLILGSLFYVLAGAAALFKLDYSLVIVLAAVIFLALGFFVKIKSEWHKLFKKKKV